MIQIIFVVETNAQAKTDDRYILPIVRQRYDMKSNEYRINFVHMNGKDKFKARSVLAEIKKFITLNSDGTNHVVYCFDTDKINISASDRKNFEEKITFCNDNSYELGWFNTCIEHVILGVEVSSKDKIKLAQRFYKNTPAIDFDKLIQIDYYKVGYSNICLVLDKILKIK